MHTSIMTLTVCNDEYFRFYVCNRTLATRFVRVLGSDILPFFPPFFFLSFLFFLFLQKRDRIAAHASRTTPLVDSRERLTGRAVQAKTKINFHIRMLYWNCPSKDNSLAAEGPSRCVMRDFIAVTGIGRGHRAHALSPRFCLTDYFIYGQRVYVHGRASWLCARRRALKSACKTLLPAAGLDKNSRCV